MQDVARYVNDLTRMLDNGDDLALKRILGELQASYPLHGSETLTDEAFSNFLRRYSKP